MTVPLTAEILRANYDFLNDTPPFSKWNLPAGEDIKFKVSNDRNCHGWISTKKGQKPQIVISRKLVGHTMNLTMTMSHEMIHLHQYLTGMPLTHGPHFDKLKARVCRIHGFDPKAF